MLMAGNPMIWFFMYGVIVPLIILVASLWTGWGGILVAIGVFLWIGLAVSMLSPKEAE